MRLLSRVVAPAALALAIGGCSLGGMLGGGGKAPATLLTLTPEAPADRRIHALGERRAGGDDRHAGHRQGAAHGPRPGPDRADRRRNM